MALAPSATKPATKFDFKSFFSTLYRVSLGIYFSGIVVAAIAFCISFPHFILPILAIAVGATCVSVGFLNLMTNACKRVVGLFNKAVEASSAVPSRPSEHGPSGASASAAAEAPRKRPVADSTQAIQSAFANAPMKTVHFKKNKSGANELAPQPAAQTPQTNRSTQKTVYFNRYESGANELAPQPAVPAVPAVPTPMPNDTCIIN
jgi:hypothetical protein